MSRGQAIEFLLAGVNNADGSVLSGGKVFTYEPGTTIFKATYQDPGFTTPHTNPIVLDSLGSKEVFASGLMDIVIKDPDEAITLYTYEDLYYGLFDGSGIYGGEAYGSAYVSTYLISNGLSTRLVGGELITFRAHETNTTVAYLEYNGIGTKQIYNNKTRAALVGGEIVENSFCLLIYEEFAGNFYLLNPLI